MATDDISNMIVFSQVVGSNPKKDNSWATVDDSALEHLRPPPGLSKNSSNIWGLDSLVSGGHTQMKEKDTKWDSPIKKSLFEGCYSSLLGNKNGGKDSFSSFDILGGGNNSDELWKSEDSEFPATGLDKVCPQCNVLVYLFINEKLSGTSK